MKPTTPKRHKMENVVIGYQNERYASNNSANKKDIEKIPPRLSDETWERTKKAIITMGRKAYRKGLPKAPITDTEFMKKMLKTDNIEAREVASKLWSEGWIYESLDAEWND